MRVAMLTYSTRARGGVAHALKLAEHLRSEGVDVSLHSLARSDDQQALAGYYRPTDVPYEIYPFDWHEDVMVRLGRMIDEYVSNLPKDADIYHSQDCVGGTALHKMRASKALDAPVLRTVHHVDDFAEPRLFEFEKEAVRHSDRRFVVSRFWKAALKRDFGLESEVVYNGIDLDRFDPLPGKRSQQPNILFVGGFEPRKGLESLILALEIVHRTVPDAVLRVVAKTGFRGTDSEDWFRVLAERARVAHAVEFHQSVDDDTLLGFYSDCDIAALPSRNEGWGLSLMEAMACRKPVVATRVGGVPELVRDGVDGLLVEPGDVTGLAEAMVRLLVDGPLRSRMGAHAHERVSGFSWEEAARVTLGVYRGLL